MRVTQLDVGWISQVDLVRGSLDALAVRLAAKRGARLDAGVQSAQPRQTVWNEHEALANAMGRPPRFRAHQPPARRLLGEQLPGGLALEKRPAENRPIRIGLIGAGKFGSMYLAQFPRTPGVHLVGIADLPPDGARAQTAGVVYSLAFGDQPALICDLVDWARTCGFPVVAAGRGHKWLTHFCESTPETVWGYHGLTPEQAERRA